MDRYVLRFASSRIDSFSLDELVVYCHASSVFVMDVQHFGSNCS